MTSQPVQAPTGMRYGEKKALEDAQAAIPLPNNTQQPVSGSTPAEGAPVPRPDVFGATQRPSEPLTAGAAEGAGPTQTGMLPPDPLYLLRATILNGYDVDGSVRHILEGWVMSRE